MSNVRITSRETSQAIFRKLVFNFDSDLWNEYDVAKLRMIELQTLAMLVGAPKSGRKDDVVVRVLAVRCVREKLSKFGNDAAEVLPHFRKEALKHMARECGLWRSGNKLQLAAVLLTWRNRVRAEGEKLLGELIATSRSAATQQQLAIAA